MKEITIALSGLYNRCPWCHESLANETLGKDLKLGETGFGACVQCGHLCIFHGEVHQYLKVFALWIQPMSREFLLALPEAAHKGVHQFQENIHIALGHWG